MTPLSRFSLCLLTVASVAGCASQSLPPPLTCDQITAESDQAFLALDGLFPKLQVESNHSLAYWIKVFFPAGDAIPPDQPQRAAALALTTGYKQLLLQSQAQHCALPLPSLSFDLMSRAYLANQALFRRAGQPVGAVHAAGHTGRQ